jgi:predicted DNA-binding ribbon-helix-helix protein
METRLTSSALRARERKKRRYLYSPVIKRSISRAGHKTSLSLEDRFWDGLCEIAQNENVSLQDLIERIDKAPIGSNLSSSARLFVLNYFRTHGQSVRC